MNEMIILIRDSFIPAFKILNETLLEKLDEAEKTQRRMENTLQGQRGRQLVSHLAERLTAAAPRRLEGGEK